MNNITMGILALMGTASAVYTDVPDSMKSIFDDSIKAAQQVSTAGDLHSMSVMLDAKYVMDRDLPSKKEFAVWMEDTFKENNVKSLSEDHWGNEYLYTVDDRQRNYQLRSAGPDGILNNDDDMVKTGP
jgi:general secretion pathway protein G